MKKIGRLSFVISLILFFITGCGAGKDDSRLHNIYFESTMFIAALGID